MDTEFRNHFQWGKNVLKKSKSESLSHAWLLIWGITDHCRMINGWVLTKNVQKNIFSPMNCMKVQKPKWKVVTDHDWSGRTNAAASSGRLASLGTISRVPKAAPGMPEWFLWRPLKNKKINAHIFTGLKNHEISQKFKKYFFLLWPTLKTDKMKCHYFFLFLKYFNNF